MELEEARDGSRLALSRALTLVENGAAFNTEEEGIILGITGAPGVGKSCLVDQLAKAYTERGEKVAILAVDPSSPVSGGALLGDRLRMDSADLEELVYMRSVATRGEAGAVPSVVIGMTNVLKECGWKRILIETVGSGQSEFRIAAIADTILLVEAPGRGDVIQAEKAGIIELVDVVAVNKSDLTGAESTAADISNALSAGSKEIPVALVSAHSGTGVSELIELMEKAGGNEISRTRWRERMFSEWMRLLTQHPDFENTLDSLESGGIDLSQAIEKMR
ncbi:MAG: hypothetical protein NZ770_08470 [Candidatus Poseidoniaceae archaeon]|nr:hypothetical protein [Candidatus Poseidoniaceae archaeon]